MGSIFGGSKSTSNSSNRAYDFLKEQFGDVTNATSSGLGGLQALLGGDASGFNAYKKATGFDAAAELGSRGITGNQAAAGMLRSGGTGKALQAYGNTIQNQFADNYMSKLLAQAGIGINAGQLLASAGQTSSETKKSKNGIGGFLGKIGAGIAASDRRLKKNIYKIGVLKDGLNVYQYRYIDGSGPYVGVMADEVEIIKPEALGPIVAGFQTVNYDNIGRV